jgi:hypothetical protein
MSDTSAQERKSRDASQLDRLLRMLRSMSRRFPRTRLLTTVDGFGASLADGRSLHIVCNGHWSDADLRDFLALFATWLVTDPRRLRVAGIPLDGALQQEDAE